MKTVFALEILGLGVLSVHAAALSSRVATPAPLRFAGVNIAGFDFGCGTDGTCDITKVTPPLTQYGGGDGAGEMTHFVETDGYNFFRLPVGWQYLTNNSLGGTLYQPNFEKYDTLVQICLNTGAYCEVDIHNYARWNGAIIGQGGPTNEQFAAIWTSLASHYKDDSRVVFGVMNEPHDLPSISIWAESVQAAVTAIRNAGATSQLVLLPGTDYSSAGSFVSSGSADALSKVVNADGSKTNLIFDVHKYLDYDGSGTHADCVTNNTVEVWIPLSKYLRANGRQAINTETGGGNTASCVKYLCQQKAFQESIADVLLGYSGWAAGSFAPYYVLSSTPTKNGTTWHDTLTVSSCLSPSADIHANEG